MSEAYEYGGYIYSDDDLSRVVNNYGGNLHSFFTALEDCGEVVSFVVYKSTDTQNIYETEWPCIEKEFYRYRINPIDPSEPHWEHLGDGTICCSECGNDSPTGEEFAYCPYCGEKLKGIDDD